MFFCRVFNSACTKRLLVSSRNSSELSSARLIDGKSLALDIRKDLKKKVLRWIDEGHRPPKLTAVLVGDHAASQAYIKIKLKTAQRIGIQAEVRNMKADIAESDLLKEVNILNQDPDVDGILVQLPLPDHISERRICNTVIPEKDVDGFNELNIGRLALNMSAVVPCTALAVVHMIRSTGLDVKGKFAVVCGRSKNVGLPIALMLHSQENGDVEGLNMTTAICHRYTPPDQLADLTRIADVIVSAAGVPGLIRKEIVKPGACIIDVGMTRTVDSDNKPTFVGDVDFEGVKEVAGWISPVPGGVGPVTVAMLMRNTFNAAITYQKARSDSQSSKLEKNFTI